MTIAEKVTRAKADYDEVHANGYNRGRDDGMSEGWQVGRKVGYDEGVNAGMEQGIEIGKQTERERFWEIFQDGGTPQAMAAGMFQGYTWTDEIYDPRYTIYCGWSANAMYQLSSITNTKVPIDLTGVGVNCTNMFAQSAVRTITELIVAETTRLHQTFTSATELANIVMSGTIARDCNFQWCPLTVASMKSVISRLKNFAGTSSEGAYTLTFTDDCWAALENSGTAPDGGTWRGYVYSLGWGF